MVIPVYNHADYLEASITSVLSQTGPQVECIVVNDGSSDHFEKVVSKFSHHKNLLVYNQENAGIGAALNSGFKLASGDFYTWISADNYYYPGALNELANCLLRDSRISLAFGDVTLIDSKGDDFLNSGYRPQDQSPPGSNRLVLPSGPISLIDFPDNFVNSAFLFRASHYKRLGGFSERRDGVEDYDFWLKLERLGTVRNVENSSPLAAYRLHEATETSRLNSDNLREATVETFENEKKLRASVSRASFETHPQLAGLLRELAVHSKESNEKCEDILTYHSGPKSLDLRVQNTNKALRSSSPFVSQLPLELSDTRALDRAFALPAIPNIEVCSKFRLARSAYFRTSEGMAELVGLHLGSLESLLSSNLSTSFDWLNIQAAGEKLSSVPAENSRIKNFTDDSDNQALLSCLSSADFLYLPQSSNQYSSQVFEALFLSAFSGLPCLCNSRAVIEATGFDSLPPHILDVEHKSLDKALSQISRSVLSQACDNWLESLNSSHNLLSIEAEAHLRSY